MTDRPSLPTSVAAALVLALAGCAAQSPTTTSPVPDSLEPGAGEVAFVTLAARGVQIYECRAKKDAPSATEWAFVAPEAELFDAQGRRAGKHYAGPHWESIDGSKVVGTLKARADAPRAGSIPWLLLTTRSDGPPGVFASVTSVQRIDTAGGAMPPAEGCTAASLGQTARVAYAADYVMFARGY